MTQQISDRDEQTLEHIKLIILQKLSKEGEWETFVPGVYFSRKNRAAWMNHCLTLPMAGLMVQGEKLINCGSREIILKAGQILIACVDSPNSSIPRDISPEHPLLSLFFVLDKMIFAEFPVTTFNNNSDGKNCQSMSARKADSSFLETMLRLAQICVDGIQAQVMGPLLLRELHYMLLNGPEGNLLRELYIKASRDSRIVDAIAYLKENLHQNMPVETLAKKVHMSVSSLHRHFRSVTGYSPLQYHKHLRLYEAQRLMLVENERADIAALTVGYESVTQFNREYKRKFGLPPHKDIMRRKMAT